MKMSSNSISDHVLQGDSTKTSHDSHAISHSSAYSYVMMSEWGDSQLLCLYSLNRDATVNY